MGANSTLGEQRGVLGLHGDNLNVGVLLLQVLTRTGDGAAGTDAGHENVDLAVGSFPNLGAGGLVVNGGVSLVGELRSQDSVLGVGNDFLSLLHGAAHTLGTGGQHDLRTVCAQQDAALSGHGLGHGQDDAVATSRTDHGQGDTGVTGGALDDGAAGLQSAGLLGGVDDGAADTVLDGTCGVVELELDGDVTGQALVQTVQADQGSLADSLDDAVDNLCHGGAPSEHGGGDYRNSWASPVNNLGTWTLYYSAAAGLNLRSQFVT